jgi:heme/copper-type cytochrome/quinol oxidase subunit 4
MLVLEIVIFAFLLSLSALLVRKIFITKSKRLLILLSSIVLTIIAFYLRFYTNYDYYWLDMIGIAAICAFLYLVVFIVMDFKKKAKKF